MTSCVSCSKSFEAKRSDKRTCSAACKKAAQRAKGDTGHTATENPPNALSGAPDHDYMRLFPGLKPLSAVEAKAMGIHPLGEKRAGMAGLFYRRAA